MDYLAHFLNECNIYLEAAFFTECDATWRDENVISLRNCIYYITEGEGELILNHQSYFPTAGDIVIIPYGTHVTYHPINENYYKKYWCHFQAQHTSMHLFDFITVPYVIKSNAPEEITSVFTALTQSFQTQTSFSPLILNGYLQHLLALCLKDVGIERLSYSQSVPTDKIELLNQYIYAHLESEITLAELADLVHFHPNYFIRFFKKYFGTSPLKYVSNVRIERAKELLKTTALSITEISEQLGYSSAYHFSARFKEAVGYSPRSYRKL
jgi:AraC-like DNA-binding protein